MKLRKINDTTINCIITQDDLKKHGILLDDLFDRKKNAVEFIKRIILKAASSVNLNFKNDYTSMRISVLPDQSVSLTISQDPEESARIREQKDLSVLPVKDSGVAAGRSAAGETAKGSGDLSASGTYLFSFPSIKAAVPACRILASFYGIESSLYFVNDTGSYYLVVGKGIDPSDDHDRIVLSINEFGKMVTCSDKTLAYIKEHSDCILRSRAAQQISELYS